jgi:CDP-6-deoxy-D-xylo-4-hexulose-3-dehydrase
MHNDNKVGTFGWASNFSFYYAHHMTTIEGGMISTDNLELYEILRMMRSHGMVRESSLEETRQSYTRNYPDLNPDFIFSYPAHNMRSTEINAVLGLSQLVRLDDQIKIRQSNFERFLNEINDKIFRTDFEVTGNSNYAFTLVLKESDFNLRDSVELKLKQKGIEFRRGLAGGGNQLRQPYLRNRPGVPLPESLPEVDHVHHFGWYMGNYPDLNPKFFKDIQHLA